MKKIFLYIVTSACPLTCSPETDSLTTEHKDTMFFAMKSGNEKRVKSFLDKGFDINTKNKDGETVLFNALRFHNLDVVKYIFNKDPNQINAKNDAGQTPLFYAVQYGTLDAIKYLLEQGADINAKDTQGNRTPLFFAALFNDLDKVNYLVGQGADINAMDKTGNKLLTFVTDEKIKKYLQENQKQS